MSDERMGIGNWRFWFFWVDWLDYGRVVFG